MTFQYLTLDMIDTVKKKGGFIDQKTFKTAGKYDSLILTDACTFSMATSRAISFLSTEINGDQHGKLGEIHDEQLVFGVIRK